MIDILNIGTALCFAVLVMCGVGLVLLKLGKTRHE